MARGEAAQASAGILLYRRTPGLEVFIAHMGGPFWSRKDAAAWSIPKGLYQPGETPLAAAIREFAEEIGTPPPEADYGLLGEFRVSSAKVVTVFTAETDFVLEAIDSNLFTMEWPPRSGRIQEFPEMDNAGWFPVDVAREKLVKGQRPMLDALH
jgi:predicted NUDIX family NTP pyrophosphohydrolase